jgi:hypothetical protein
LTKGPKKTQKALELSHEDKKDRQTAQKADKARTDQALDPHPLGEVVPVFEFVPPLSRSISRTPGFVYIADWPGLGTGIEVRLCALN